MVVSNAGGSPYADAATASPRFHAKIIELNLIAPLHVAQSANAVMQGQSGGGSIIMIGSVSGTRPSPGTAAYGAAKAGLHQPGHQPRGRVGPEGPGEQRRGRAGGDRRGRGRALRGVPPRMAAVAATVPLRRMATPEDVAGACLFLASPLASYVSGAALLLHGGGERPAFLAALQRFGVRLPEN